MPECSYCNTYSACAPCFAEHFEPDYHHTQAKQGFVDWNPPRDLFREECCRSFGISFDGMPGVIWERPTTTTCSPKDGSAAGCIYTQSWPALDSSPRMYMKDGKWVVGEGAGSRTQSFYSTDSHVLHYIARGEGGCPDAVSYTHLTLPTILLV